MVEREVAGLGLGNVEVVGFNALLVKFAQKQGASVIIRGLRAVADFEYEYQMAGMNQQLDDDIETVFLMADVSLQPIASKLVKENRDLWRRHRQNSSAPRCALRSRRGFAKPGPKGDY